MLNKVPRCEKCDLLKTDKDRNCTYFYCKHEGYEDYGSISVERLPDTSPKWCPLRNSFPIRNKSIKQFEKEFRNKGISEHDIKLAVDFIVKARKRVGSPE